MTFFSLWNREPTQSHLDDKVPKLQVTQDLVHDLQALSIRNHWVKLPSNVKVLGAEEVMGAPGREALARHTLLLCSSWRHSSWKNPPGIVVTTLTHW